MSHVTCPNCSATLTSAANDEPPTTCPECCARLQRDSALMRAPFPAQELRPRTLDRVILSGRDAPAVARREFRSFAEPLGEEVTTTGSLLISEMVTNSVRHGPASPSSTIAMHCAVVDDRLQVEIADDGEGFVPHPREDGQDAGSGWGLHLVESLSQAWGIDRGRPTRGWFELAL